MSDRSPVLWSAQRVSLLKDGRDWEARSSPLQFRSFTTASPPSSSLLSSFASRSLSPPKTAPSTPARDRPLISPPQIQEPPPALPPPRTTVHRHQSTALPPFEPLEIETPPVRARASRLRKPSWATPKILRPPAVRLANPVNYVPRNTPITVPHPSQVSNENLPLESHRDAYPLLSIPERRRSRLTPSPNSLVVEHSQYESESGRSSIAVPRAQRQSGAFEDIPLDMENTAGPEADRPRHVQSQHSLRSQSQIASIPSNPGGPSGEPDVAEELAWGPAHPCFPHINPHVPLGSDEYLTTRIIRIKRDWMDKGDLAPTFSNLYPEILDPLLPEQEFRRVIATINEELTSAFNPYSFRNWLDGVLGLVTGWIWEDLGAPAIKGHLKRVEDWLEKWNREVGAKDGVRIWSLRRTAYMSLDIQIPDPKVGIVPSEGNRSRPGTGPDSRG
ncbi:ERF4 family protein [Aspergillus lucknowensis]|uniref:Ras modification protein ERF4 n=1 Tax=Aspergillus lucknowensis TaxID=176173 RepID=A0ABR4LJ51_9EURO